MEQQVLQPPVGAEALQEKLSPGLQQVHQLSLLARAKSARVARGPAWCNHRRTRGQTLCFPGLA